MATQGTTASTRADAARNNERILEAARTAFRVQGTSIPFYEIARSAGVGQATLYRHFPSKQALVRAVVEENARAFEEEAKATPRDDRRFEALLEALGEQIAENATLSLLTAAEVGTRWHAEMVARIVDVLEDALAQGKGTGELRSDVGRADLGLALYMMGGAVMGETLEERQENSRRARAIVLRGFQQ